MLPPNIRRASSTGVAAKGCTALSNTIKASTVTAKEIISMGWKVFGVTLKRLPLYLAEYVWRYNHRNDSIQIQKILIMKQLERLLI